MKPRLYVDEDILTRRAVLLREQGYDAVSVHEIGAEGLSDEEQLVRAAAAGRAIISFNHSHFAELAAAWCNTDRSHSGIVVSYRQYRRDQLGLLARAVESLLGGLDAAGRGHRPWPAARPRPLESSQESDMAKQHETHRSEPATAHSDNDVVIIEELENGVRIERHHDALVYHHPKSPNASPERLQEILGKWNVGLIDMTDPFEERADRLLAQLGGN